ncbi:MAG: DEAD/DEAH box helicase [Pyrobaculum sp.]
MARFSVVINGVEVVREWGWDRVVKTKEQLKRLGFRWNGVSWVVTTKSVEVVNKVRQLLELSREEYIKILSTLDIVAISSEPPEELKNGVLETLGDVYLLSPVKFLKEFVARDRAVSQVESFEEFVELGVKRFREALAGTALGDLEKALQEAKAAVVTSRGLRELFEKRRAWRVAIVGPNYAKLNFLASGLLKRLAKFRTRYNVVTREGELEARDIKLVQVIDREVRFPVFLRRQVVEVLKEFGYVPQVAEVEYPQVDYRKSFTLYPFQIEAVENWLSHGMRGTVVIPTGGGKTFIGMEAIYRAGVSALVLVTTRELAAQWVSRLRRYLGVSPGLLGGGERDVRDVTVAIYNSAVKYIDSLLDRFGLAIFDEAHHVPAETFKEVALKIDSPYRLALSATPEREDENEHLIYEAVGPPVYRVTYRSMIAAGLVVPVEHYRIYVELSKEEAAAYSSLPEDNVILLRNTAAKAADKIPTAISIVAREVETSSKVLVFTQFIDQAEELYRRLKEGGIAAELITSEEGGREAALGRFSAGLSKVVVTTTVLDEGVDVPDADVAVVVSGTGSKRQMIQRVGRVVRASPGKKVAKVYEIVARRTIEEALSEARHFSDVIEEVACKKLFS